MSPDTMPPRTTPLVVITLAIVVFVAGILWGRASAKRQALHAPGTLKISGAMGKPPVRK